MMPSHRKGFKNICLEIFTRALVANLRMLLNIQETRKEF